MTMTDVATAIRVEMARNGLTQRDLAEALGVTQATVSSRMNGHTEWTIRELQIVAATCGVAVTDLLAGAA